MRFWMANVGIEKKDVFSAAEALLGDRKEPTIQAIREKLGNTGSLSTISKHLKEWQAFKRNQSPVANPPEAFGLAAQGLWALAFREAEKVFQIQKDALLLEQQKWEEEKKVFSDEIEALEADKESSEHRIKELVESLEKESHLRNELSKSITESGEQRARLQGEIEALKDRLNAEVERGQRLEKEIADIAKGKNK